MQSKSNGSSAFLSRQSGSLNNSGRAANQAQDLLNQMKSGMDDFNNKVMEYRSARLADFQRL